MDNLMLITVIETKLYLPLEVSKDRVFYGLAIHNLDNLLENKEKLCVEQFKLRNVEWYDIVSPFDFDRVNTWFLKKKLLYEKKYSWQLDLRNINMMPNVCDYFGKKFSEMHIGEWYTNAVKTFYYMKIDAMHFFSVEQYEFNQFLVSKDKEKWVSDYLLTAQIKDFPLYEFQVFKVLETDFKYKKGDREE